MSWQSVADVTKTYLLSQPKGCRDCGTIKTFTSENGMIIEYPGVECCPPAIRRQISWRAAELDQLNKRVSERRAAVEELKRKSADGDRHSAAYAAQAVRAFDALMERGRGAWALEIDELAKEIRRLKARLNALEGHG